MDVYLKKYVDAITTIANQEEYLTVRDLSSAYCYASEKAYTMLGFLSLKELLGKNISNVHSNVSKLNESFKLLDNNCIKSKLAIEAYGVLDFSNNGLNLYALSIYPIIDLGGNLVGFKDLLKNIYQLDYFILNKMNHYFKLNSNICKVENSNPSVETMPNLTEQEYLILFLLVFGFKVKQISNFIASNGGSNSASTIRNIIHRQLFPKLNATSLQSLIEKAYHLNILTTTIPSVFANYQFLIQSTA